MMDRAYTPQHLVVLHLSLIPRVGPAAIFALCARMVGCDVRDIASWRGVVRTAPLDNLYRYSVADMMRAGLSELLAQACVAGLADHELLAQEMAHVQRYHAQLVMFFDVDYPERLAHIHLPPAVLYVRGDTGVLARRSGAIVGSRNANDYAQRVLRTLIPPLVGAGLVVVSGGARGVDGMAHAITSASGGQTVVVLGSGLARPYPAEHRALFDEVLATGGAVVSPFPMMMQAERGNFPARNRIIAGLSEGVIVVQAARKSGALITAQYALEQGRFVGAVPGSIDDPLSEGCHALLKEGAVVIAGVEDVCAEFGLVPTAVDLEPEKKSTVSDVVQEPRSLVHPLLALLDEPQSFDYLFTRAQLSYGDLQEQLFTLQLEGYIDQDPVGRWYRCSMNR